MSFRLFIQIHPGLSLRDPQQTILGRKIISASVLLINEIGFEKFTFRKLAKQIDSTEASIYRYFENKHLLLTYLLCWYWEWVGFQMDLQTTSLKDPKEKMSQTISILVSASIPNNMEEFIDISSLYSIVVAEGTKAYHTKAIDDEHSKGYFSSYVQLVEKIGKTIREINPSFPFPKTLASNLIEMSANHIYFSQHLPSLTDVNSDPEQMKKMLEYFTFRLLDE